MGYMDSVIKKFKDETVAQDSFPEINGIKVLFDEKSGQLALAVDELFGFIFLHRKEGTQVWPWIKIRGDKLDNWLPGALARTINYIFRFTEVDIICALVFEGDGVNAKLYESVGMKPSKFTVEGRNAIKYSIDLKTCIEFFNTNGLLKTSKEKKLIDGGGNPSQPQNNAFNSMARIKAWTKKPMGRNGC